MMTVSTLEGQASFLRQGMVAMTRSSGEADCDRFVWSETVIASKDIPDNGSPIGLPFGKRQNIHLYGQRSTIAPPKCHLYGSLVLDEWMQSARDLKNECIHARCISPTVP